MQNRTIVLLLIVFSYLTILFSLSTGSNGMYRYDDTNWRKPTFPVDSLRVKLDLLTEELERYNDVATVTTTDLASVSDAYQIVNIRLKEIGELLAE